MSEVVRAAFPEEIAGPLTLSLTGGFANDSAQGACQVRSKALGARLQS